MNHLRAQIFSPLFRGALAWQEPDTTKPLDQNQDDPINREIHEDKNDKKAADADLAESGTAAQMESGPRKKRQLDPLDTETHSFADLDADAWGAAFSGCCLPVRDVSVDNQRIWLQESLEKPIRLMMT